MREGISACWACQRPLPSTLIHDHHKQPRAAGGGDEQTNREIICPNCHQCVHQASRLHVRGKTSQAKDMVHVYVQGDRPAAGRIWELVQEECQAWTSGDPGVLSDKQKVTLDIERGVYQALKGIGRHIKGPNKRPIGASGLIAAILKKWLEEYMDKHGGKLGDYYKRRGPTSTTRQRPELVSKGD
jgi:hypothetical protein